ncbi:hypothetical protein F4803DRAFT_550418 [Xylaria telfairii]|nr:hypothetical protein F4803DRAFT_550418 [Xylaria telfairii]
MTSFTHGRLRPAINSPPPTPPVLETSFYHPDYPSPHDLLFKLPRLDQYESSAKGVHYGTAITACQITANNVNGYLSTDRAGQDRIDGDYDSVLTAPSYWFFVADDEITDPLTLRPKLPYPVVPSFQDWAFPHHDSAEDAT